MNMLDLSSWAALAEIVATVAVVLSLLLVAYSIKRNTDEMETANSNFFISLMHKLRVTYLETLD